MLNNTKRETINLIRIFDNKSNRTLNTNNMTQTSSVNYS